MLNYCGGYGRAAPSFEIGCRRQSVRGNDKCVNMLTECRHRQDAVSNSAEPGGRGKDQTAAVVRG